MRPPRVGGDAYDERVRRLRLLEGRGEPRTHISGALLSRQHFDHATCILPDAVDGPEEAAQQREHPGMVLPRVLEPDHEERQRPLEELCTRELVIEPAAEPVMRRDVARIEPGGREHGDRYGTEKHLVAVNELGELDRLTTHGRAVGGAEILDGPPPGAPTNRACCRDRLASSMITSDGADRPSTTASPGASGMTILPSRHATTRQVASAIRSRPRSVSAERPLSFSVSRSSPAILRVRE